MFGPAGADGVCISSSAFGSDWGVKATVIAFAFAIAIPAVVAVGHAQCLSVQREDRFRR